MRQDWMDFLASKGASNGLEDFGDVQAELEAARGGTVVVPLADFGVIRASGEEAAPFLHNLLTNDVKNLAPDAVRFAGLCTAKGRLIASLHLWHGVNDDLLLMLSADILPAILKKLSMYVLRSKVKLTDASDLVLIGLAGPAAEAALMSVGASIPFPLQATPVGQGQVLRLDERRFVLAIPADAAAAVWAQLTTHARAAGTAAWCWIEIAGGQPRIVSQTQELFVPQMANFETPAVGGVSFTKGCYPGQEIVARAQYLGKVKRRMYPAHLDTAVAPGVGVFSPETGEQHCGNIASAAPSPDGGYDVLVVVQASCAEAGDVRVGSLDGARLRFGALPYAVT